MKKIKINAEMVISFFFFVLGLVVMKVSQGYGLWDRISPSKGFMPFVAAALMSVCSLWWLVQTVIRRRKESGDGEIKFSLNEIKWMILIPLICFLTVFVMKWIGLYAAIGLFLLGWFLFIDHYSILRSLVLTVLLTVMFYLVFTVGLKVPFPKFSLF